MAAVEVGEEGGRIAPRAVLPERLRRADCLFRIHTVRGPIVGRAALVEALRGGRIAGGGAGGLRQGHSSRSLLPRPGP